MADKALSDFDFGDTGVNGLFSIGTTLYALPPPPTSGIYAGSTEVSSVRIGSTVVNQIYIGPTKVFG
tara:strand:- start:22 stop:222 length:201 start_codon:yes stop_codon:yes gene_type:complete